MEFSKYFHKSAFSNSGTNGLDIKKWLIKFLAEVGITTTDVCCGGDTIDSKITALRTQSGTFTEYRILITQAGTAAPTVKVLNNTLGTVTPNYTSPGVYTLDSAALFTANKTEAWIGKNSDVRDLTLISKISTSQYVINTWDGVGATLANGLLTDTELYIRVYA